MNESTERCKCKSILFLCGQSMEMLLLIDLKKGRDLFICITEAHTCAVVFMDRRDPWIHLDFEPRYYYCRHTLSLQVLCTCQVKGNHGLIIRLINYVCAPSPLKKKFSPLFLPEKNAKSFPLCHYSVVMRE